MAPRGTGQGNPRFVTPVRVLDTRPGLATGFNADGSPVAGGRVTAGIAQRFKLAGKTFSQATLPTDTTGVMLNVTVIQGVGSGGFVTVYSGNQLDPPNASTVNPSTAVAFNAWAMGSPTAGANAGTFGVYSTNALDVVVDVVGYYAPSNSTGAGELSLVAPVRVVDTRAAFGGPIGYSTGGASGPAAPMVPCQPRRFSVGGRTFGAVAIPADVKGILCNVTIIQGVGSGGYVTVYPGSAGPPNASTVIPVTGVAASFWGTGLADAALAVYSTNQLDVVIDVAGYFR